jgi:hypothetical protein
LPPATSSPTFSADDLSNEQPDQEHLYVKITEVEAIILRQPVVDGAIADGSQDDLIVRIHTDEGITGVGEVDSAPEVVKAVYEAPHSHYIATGLRHVLIGQDPLDIEDLWRRMYMGSVYYGRRGVAMHAISVSTSRSGTSRERSSASPCASCSARSSAIACALTRRC